jgi:hypothetical protein
MLQYVLRTQKGNDPPPPQPAGIFQLQKERTDSTSRLSHYGRSQARRSGVPTRGSPTTVEDLVNEAFWSDIFHIHLQWRLHGNGQDKLHRSPPMKATMNRVVDKSNQASCDNNASHRMLDQRSLVLNYHAKGLLLLTRQHQSVQR